MRLRRYEDNSGSSYGYWLIAGLEEVVVWQDSHRGWKLGIKPVDPKDFHVLDSVYSSHVTERVPYLTWLRESRLEGQSFKSRRQALDALKIALEMFPIKEGILR